MSITAELYSFKDVAILNPMAFFNPKLSPKLQIQNGCLSFELKERFLTFKCA